MAPAAPNFRFVWPSIRPQFDLFYRPVHASTGAACGFLCHKVCKAVRVMPMNTMNPNERIVSSSPNKKAGSKEQRAGIRTFFSPAPCSVLPAIKRGTRHDQAGFITEYCGERAECVATIRG